MLWTATQLLQHLGMGSSFCSVACAYPMPQTQVQVFLGQPLPGLGFHCWKRALESYSSICFAYKYTGRAGQVTLLQHQFHIQPYAAHARTPFRSVPCNSKPFLALQPVHAKTVTPLVLQTQRAFSPRFPLLPEVEFPPFSLWRDRPTCR